MRTAAKKNTGTARGVARVPVPSARPEVSGIRTIHVAHAHPRGACRVSGPGASHGSRPQARHDDANGFAPSPRRGASSASSTSPKGRRPIASGPSSSRSVRPQPSRNTHVSVAYPFLTELRDQVQETTIFATRFQDQAIVLVCLDSGRPTTVVVRPGTIVNCPSRRRRRVLWAFTAEARERLDEAARRFDYSRVPVSRRRSSRKKIRAALKITTTTRSKCGVTAGRHCMPGVRAQQRRRCHGWRAPAFVAISDPPPKQLIDKLKTCAARISAALGSNCLEETPSAEGFTPPCLPASQRVAPRCLRPLAPESPRVSSRASRSSD